MYILADINEIVENKNICSKKDIFWKKIHKTKFLFFNF